MGARNKRADRCERCRLHRPRCICAEIPSLALATKLVVIMHRRELAKPTGTARLALAALSNSELWIHGHQEHRLDVTTLAGPKRRLLLLSPAQDAAVLTAAFVAADPRPVTLLVPDGSWRQASKAAARIPGMDLATRVTLAAGLPSGYAMREEPKDGGLATVEAIARALGIIESADAERALETVFRRFVAETMASRGAPSQ